jgi:hypothetical protein
MGLSNAYFRSLGLPSLTRGVSVTARTAVYGPVRTVVWQGSAGDRHPYGPLSKVRKANPAYATARFMPNCALTKSGRRVLPTNGPEFYQRGNGSDRRDRSHRHNGSRAHHDFRFRHHPTGSQG